MSAARVVEIGPLWDRVLMHRTRIAAFVVAVTLLTGVIAFVLPPWYRAVASLLPPSEEESGFGLASLLKGIGVPGVKVPTQAAPADVFLAVLQSRRINEEMVRRFDLQKFYRKKLVEDALRELRRHVAFGVSDAGMITIAVEDRDPGHAAQMANAYIEILDRFNREVRTTKGRRTREFVERRLAETRVELQQSEQRLASYQSRNKTIALTPEVSSAVETAARLYAERAALLVRIGVIEGYSRGPSDEAARIRQQMAQMDRQLQALPATGLDAARLLRDVKTLEALFALLTAQYEEARITEARDIATVEVLDVATPPERKARPKRGVLIASAFLISLGGGIAWSLLQPPPGDEERARG